MVERYKGLNYLLILILFFIIDDLLAWCPVLSGYVHCYPVAGGLGSKRSPSSQTFVPNKG
jgi:hypothetical protein